jgi:hypothetical protein
MILFFLLSIYVKLNESFLECLKIYSFDSFLENDGQKDLYNEYRCVNTTMMCVN